MKKKTILLIFFSIVLIGAIIWCVNTPYREVNLNDTLETIQKNDTCITVHDLYKDKDWDKMVIIKPYDKRTASDEKIDMGYTGIAKQYLITHCLIVSVRFYSLKEIN